MYKRQDLLIARPGYIEAGDLPPSDHIIEAVRRCRVLTTTSLRLARLLEERVGEKLQHKVVVCPNALELPVGWTRPPQKPQGIVFTQSHRLALGASREPVFAAVRELAQRQGLKIHYFGPPLEVLGRGVPELVGEVVHCGYLDFWRYHAVLAALPSMIGIAPLETVGDRETLDFVAGKSDIKMVEYAGFGHPSVYSAAPAYVDTDLRAGEVAENTYEGWSAALERLVDEGWAKAGDEQAAVHAARSMDRVAAEHWATALQRSQCPEARVAGPLLTRGRPRGSAWRLARAKRTAERGESPDLRRLLAGEYLKGEGLEIGALHAPLPLPAAARRRFVDRMTVAQLREQYPELADANLVEVDIVDDGERLGSIAARSQDFVIANHLLEHCQDPIGTIANMMRVLRPGGVIYMAVPDKIYTFDKDRPVTPLAHLERDHREGPQWSRRGHFEEWARLVNKAGDEAAVAAQADRLMAIDYSIHYHVWTRAEMLQMVAAVSKHLRFAVRESVTNGEEVIFILQKAGGAAALPCLHAASSRTAKLRYYLKSEGFVLTAQRSLAYLARRLGYRE